MKAKCIGNSFVRLLLFAVFIAHSPQSSFASGDQTEENAPAAVMSVPLEFTVVFDKAVDAQSAWTDDSVTAHLKDDLKLNGRIAALSGATVKGHVELIDKLGNVIDPHISKNKGNAKQAAFRVVFDEVVSSANHTLKMRAVPSVQCSMIHRGRKLRSVEVTTGGVIKTAESLDGVEPSQLKPGDELVLRINLNRSVSKQKSEPVVGTLKATDSKLASAPPAAAPVSGPAPDSAAAPVSGPAPASMSASTPAPVLASASVQASASASVQAPDSASASASPSPPLTGPDSAPNPSAASSSAPISATASSPLRPKATPTQAAGQDSAPNPSAASSSTLPSKAVEATAIGSEIKERIANNAPQSKQFRVVLRSPVFSLSAKNGDLTQAQLLEPMQTSERVIAPAGSLIIGHVTEIRHSCRWGNAIVSKDARFQRSAAFKIVFSKVVTPEGKLISIAGHVPAQITVFNNGTFKKLVVNASGEITSDGNVEEEGNSALRSVPQNILKIGMTAALGPGAAIAMPLLVLGAIGSAQPAVVSSIQRTFISKGSEVYLAPGDELFVQARIGREVNGQKSVSGKVLENAAKQEL